MEKWLVGVDVGGTTIKLAFITMDGEIVEKWAINTNAANAGIHVVKDITNAITGKLTELNEPKSRLHAIGIGAPGPIDLETGIIYGAVNIGWGTYPLRTRMEEEINLPVATDNDANVAALGEMWKGAGNGAKDLVFITLGTGVGGGIVANGKIISGTNGAGGEVGHMTSIPSGGFLCNCGKTGCLETVASATGIVRIAHEKLQTATESSLRNIYIKNGRITAKNVFEQAKQGDILSLQVVNNVVFHLGLSLANIANVLNPEKIIIGGGVSKTGDFLIEKLQPYFEQFTFKRVREGATLHIATLGNDAGIFGAAWLAKMV